MGALLSDTDLRVIKVVASITIERQVQRWGKEKEYHINVRHYVILDWQK